MNKSICKNSCQERTKKNLYDFVTRLEKTWQTERLAAISDLSNKRQLYTQIKKQSRSGGQTGKNAVT